ncbi:MAG: HDOD domain-containing protein [Oceanospirillaceae bacterium]|nr:HDOD domain-containing protein [Oceanospirillaceae bacterium]
MQNQVLQVMREMKLNISMHNTRISSVMNIVNRVLDYFEFESFNYRQLSRLLENDPVMSAYILKAANVCMFNKPENVTRLDQACMMLGTSMLKTLMISHRWRACIAIRNPRIKNALITEWQKGLNLAVASYTLAHQLRHPKKDDAFLSVMLDNISLFLFAEHCDDLPKKKAL